MFDINQFLQVFKNLAANGHSTPIFVQDTKVMKFFTAVSEDANFVINVFQSIQELPPDTSMAASATNQYAPVTFQDEGNDVTYGPTNPFNPSTVDTDAHIFNVNSTGARWIFFTVTEYAAGTLVALAEESMANTV